MGLTVWTLGTSNHDWSKFEALLGAADIAVVADVRSSPSSRFPHFNRGALSSRLNGAGIGYVFLGLELGGRPRSGAPVDYDAMARSPLFHDGLAKVEDIAARARLALVCSEADPLRCHRCLLIGRQLARRGVEVRHILRDGTIETSEQAEDRLLAITARGEVDLFASRADRLSLHIQGRRIVGRTR